MPKSSHTAVVGKEKSDAAWFTIVDGFVDAIANSTVPENEGPILLENTSATSVITDSLYILEIPCEHKRQDTPNPSNAQLLVDLVVANKQRAALGFNHMIYGLACESGNVEVYWSQMQKSMVSLNHLDLSVVSLILSSEVKAGFVGKYDLRDPAQGVCLYLLLRSIQTDCIARLENIKAEVCRTSLNQAGPTLGVIRTCHRHQTHLGQLVNMAIHPWNLWTMMLTRTVGMNRLETLERLCAAGQVKPGKRLCPAARSWKLSLIHTLLPSLVLHPRIPRHCTYALSKSGLLNYRVPDRLLWTS